MVRFAPFFFFLNFGPNRAVLADIGRYGPSRPDFGRIGADFGRVGADFSRVGPIRESPRGTTRHGRAVCGVPPASPRPAASDAGALAWEPRPCIPAWESLYLSRKYLDYEEKYVLAQSKVESISFENVSLAEQVTKLIADLVKAQDCLSVLKKDLKIEKTFCALKDK